MKCFYNLYDSSAFTGKVLNALSCIHGQARSGAHPSLRDVRLLRQAVASQTGEVLRRYVYIPAYIAMCTYVVELHTQNLELHNVAELQLPLWSSTYKAFWSNVVKLHM